MVATAAPIVFNLGADPANDYLNEDVGPYLGTLTRTAVPNTWQEKEGRSWQRSPCI